MNRDMIDWTHPAVMGHFSTAALRDKSLSQNIFKTETENVIFQANTNNIRLRYNSSVIWHRRLAYLLYVINLRSFYGVQGTCLKTSERLVTTRVL